MPARGAIGTASCTSRASPRGAPLNTVEGDYRQGRQRRRAADLGFALQTGQHDHVGPLPVIGPRQPRGGKLLIELAAVGMFPRNHQRGLGLRSQPVGDAFGHDPVAGHHPQHRPTVASRVLAAGSSSRVTPTQVASGARSANPAGAVASRVSATAAECNGPINASADGSEAARAPASTASRSPCASCGTPAALITWATAAVRAAGNAE
jgi:hypothetical protein